MEPALELVLESVEGLALELDSAGVVSEWESVQEPEALALDSVPGAASACSSESWSRKSSKGMLPLWYSKARCLEGFGLRSPIRNLLPTSIAIQRPEQQNSCSQIDDSYPLQSLRLKDRKAWARIYSGSIDLVP